MFFAKLQRVSVPEALRLERLDIILQAPLCLLSTDLREPTPDTQHQCGLRITFPPGDVVLFSFANSTVECTLL